MTSQTRSLEKSRTRLVAWRLLDGRRQLMRDSRRPCLAAVAAWSDIRACRERRVRQARQLWARYERVADDCCAGSVYSAAALVGHEFEARGPKGASQLASGADFELGEHVTEVPLDGPAAEK